jgi:hypothetical protein
MLNPFEVGLSMPFRTFFGTTPRAPPILKMALAGALPVGARSSLES